MDAVAAAQWVILYMDKKPCILAGGPPGATVEQVKQQFRTAMLGKLPEGLELDVKDIFEAPVEDVVRVGVISMMTAMSKVEARMEQVASALAARGLLRH